MKYRKKPVVVEAFRLGYDREPEWFRSSARFRRFYDSGYTVIHTREGAMQVCDGNWIVRGPGGDIHPLKHHDFIETYEPVEEKEHD